MMFDVMSSSPLNVQALGVPDIPLMRAMLTMFGKAFGEVETYGAHPPSSAYLERLLGSEDLIVLAATDGTEVVGGLAAYQLRKFEQERSEIYIYDLAVAETHRRKGIATSLILKLKQIAEERGSYVVSVQADPVDAPAVALYSTLGTREDVLHFDIPIATASRDTDQANTGVRETR